MNHTIPIRLVRLLLFMAGLMAAQALPAQPVKGSAKDPFPGVQAADPEQDCPFALVICDNVYFQPNSYSGEGLLPNEINPLFSCLTAGERNDVWYQVKVVSGGLLNFTITPVNPTDDYDWAVFDLTNAQCSDIAVNAALQVSCNFSANVGCGGQTGANGSTSGLCGQQNRPPIPVQAGERYVINVSNFSATQSGYSIDFSASTAVIFDIVPPQGVNSAMGCSKDIVEVPLTEPVDAQSFTSPVSEFTLIDSTGSIVPLQAVTVDFGTGQSAAVVRLELIQPPAHAGTLFLMAATGGDGTTFSDRCGNFVTAGQQLALIDVGNDVAVDIGSDIGQCPDAPRPVLQAPVLPGAGYAWTFNGTAAGTNAPTLQTVLPGTYAVAVTLGTGCGAADSMALFLWPAPFVDLGDDTLICNGGTLPVLDAGTGGTGYAWYLDGTALATTGNMLQTTQAGWYAVQVAGTYCTTSDSIHIEAFPAIAVGLVQREYLICEGELIDPVIPDPALQYTWTMSGPTLFDSPEEIHSPSPGYLKQGWYVLTVADTNGCAVTDSIHVTVLEQPEAPVTGCPVYAGMDMTFSWTPVPGAEWYEVSEDEGNTWQYPSSGSAAFTHTTRVGLPRLMVRAMSEGNCGPGRVAEQESCGVLIPSAISPNGDGHNDFFRMANLGQYDAPSLSVFNRYGQRVFFSPDYQNDWNAEGLQRGTYFYVLDLHRHGSLRGFITVVR